MGDFDTLNNKIEDFFKRQEKTNDKMELAVEKIAESMKSFVEAQARSEERNSAVNKRLDRLETSHNKMDERLRSTREMSIRNTVIVSTVTLVIVSALKTAFFG